MVKVELNGQSLGNSTLDEMKSPLPHAPREPSSFSIL